jgi:glycerophosphoryl diester phosphodiesterase
MVDVEVKNSPMDPGHDPDEAVAGEVLEIIATGRERGPEAFPSTLQISSFSQATISALASARSGVALGLLVAPGLSAKDALVEARRLRCSTLNVFHSQVTADLVALARDQGIGVVAWTVNEPAQVASMLEAGVEAVISDDVPGALAVMRAAGYRAAPKTPPSEDGASEGGSEGGLVRDGSPRGQSMA